MSAIAAAKPAVAEKRVKLRCISDRQPRATGDDGRPRPCDKGEEIEVTETEAGLLIGAGLFAKA